jgi:hypothetical protein
MTFTRPFSRCTEPSMTPSTFNVRAISGSGGIDLLLPLKFITEVREITLRARICARLLISVSVMPSAKYSCSGSPDKFCKGSTAIDWIFGCSRFAPPRRIVTKAIVPRARRITTPAKASQRAR